MPPRLSAAACVIACLAASAALGATPALVERHDGPTNSWSLVPNRFGITAVKHERVRLDDPAGARGAEFFELSGPPGYSAMILTPIGSAPVLDDLLIRLRMQTDRPGVIPAVRVVFPRNRDPRVGQPLAAIVRGDTLARGDDQWETLQLDDLVKRVRRHARMLTGSLGKQVDDHEAYVDAVVLFVPSSPQAAHLWLDELSIDGVVREAPAGVSRSEQPGAPSKLTRVELTQSGLFVNGEPFYPRVIAHRGESLGELKKVGFNTIAFDQPPSTADLEDAAKLKLRVICPPPPESTLTSQPDCALWDPVLCWRLAGKQDSHSLDAQTAFAERLRRADRRLSRPLLAAPTEAWAPWSNLADGLLVYSPWAPAQAMTEVARQRLDEAARFAQPGAPLLAVVPTTHSESFLTQLETFAPAGSVTPWRSPSQVMAEAEAATLSGSLGIWVEGGQPLAGDSAMRTRFALALINLRLALLEPWLRDGARGGDLTCEVSQQCAATFTKGRTTLLVPYPTPTSSAAASSTYLAPGVSEGVNAYEFTPVGLRPVGLLRATGGARAAVSSSDAMLLLTDDQRAAAQVRRRQQAVMQRGLALEQALAIAELRHAESHLSPLTLTAATPTHDAAVLAEARRWISHSKTAQSTGDLEAAYRHAMTARRAIEAWKLSRLDRATADGPLDSSPLAGQSETLIDHTRLLQLIEPLTRGPNLLPGGDFEDQSSATASGWRHVARGTADAQAVVTFESNQPAHALRALRIECPAAKKGPQRATVLIKSPEVALDAGQLVEVTGQVRVDHAADGGSLTISDTIGGEELGLRVTRPTGWRSFRLLRRPNEMHRVKLTFAAQGPITVCLDAVMIRTIELPSAAKAAVLGVPALQRK